MLHPYAAPPPSTNAEMSSLWMSMFDIIFFYHFHRVIGCVCAVCVLKCKICLTFGRVNKSVSSNIPNARYGVRVLVYACVHRRLTAQLAEIKT